MKRFLMRLAALALVAALVALVLAPLMLRQLRRWRESVIAERYLAATDALDALEQGAMLAGAKSHNEALGRVRLADPFSGAEEASDAGGDYAAQMDPGGNGVMAVLEIPKLGARLPVYHGTRLAALGGGVGHLEDTSLPVGGADALCAFAAQRNGWVQGPFQGLERLIPGDCFYVRALGDTLVYQVTQALTLEPEALAKQGLQGADRCVLMTTAPYGADTHRLLVVGERISRRAAPLVDDTRTVPQWAARLIFAIPAAVVGLALVALLERLRSAAARRRIKRAKL